MIVVALRHCHQPETFSICQTVAYRQVMSAQHQQRLEVSTLIVPSIDTIVTKKKKKRCISSKILNVQHTVCLGGGEKTNIQRKTCSEQKAFIYKIVLYTLFLLPSTLSNASKLIKTPKFLVYMVLNGRVHLTQVVTVTLAAQTLHSKHYLLP